MVDETKLMELWVDSSMSTTINNLIELLEKKLGVLDEISEQWSPTDEIKFSDLLKISIHTATDFKASKILSDAIKAYNNFHLIYSFPHPHLEKMYVVDIKNAIFDAFPAAVRKYENYSVDMFHEGVQKRNKIRPRPIMNMSDYRNFKKDVQGG